MDQKKARVEYLLKKYLNKTCSWEEFRELFSSIGKEEYRDIVYQAMKENYKTLVPGTDVHTINWDKMYESIVNTPDKGRISFLRSFRFYTAAALFVIIGFAFYQWNSLRYAQETGNGQHTATKKDLAPGGNKAILKLADGSEIILDEQSNGQLANQGRAVISKASDGTLLYNASGNPRPASQGAASLLNTLATPRGGQYMVVLPDQSRVWLNAESSLTFPAVFTGDIREVSLKGEGYFEIAKDQSHPFIVKNGTAAIRVLGTHFNVMAYEDEPLTEVTLSEGSVSLHIGNTSQIMKPGQQARFSRKADKITLTTIDTTDAIDWKNGFFQFDNTPIDLVMRQIKRWYDTEIVYEGTKPDLFFTGVISRNIKVSEVLALLEETGGVSFEINDQQITVKNKKKEMNM